MRQFSRWKGACSAGLRECSAAAGFKWSVWCVGVYRLCVSCNLAIDVVYCGKGPSDPVVFEIQAFSRYSVVQQKILVLFA